MSLERGFWFARRDVPKFDGLVVASGGQCFAVGTECDGANRFGMAFDGQHRFVGLLPMPKSNRAIQAARCQ